MRCCRIRTTFDRKARMFRRQFRFAFHHKHICQRQLRNSKIGIERYCLPKFFQYQGGLLCFNSLGVCAT